LGKVGYMEGSGWLGWAVRVVQVRSLLGKDLRVELQQAFIYNCLTRLGEHPFSSFQTLRDRG
jgi:hypothetical protein